jgi:hypothetical protein
MNEAKPLGPPLSNPDEMNEQRSPAPYESFTAKMMRERRELAEEKAQLVFALRAIANYCDNQQAEMARVVLAKVTP